MKMLALNLDLHMLSEAEEDVERLVKIMGEGKKARVYTNHPDYFGEEMELDEALEHLKRTRTGEEAYAGIMFDAEELPLGFAFNAHASYDHSKQTGFKITMFAPWYFKYAPYDQLQAAVDGNRLPDAPVEKINEYAKRILQVYNSSHNKDSFQLSAYYIFSYQDKVELQDAILQLAKKCGNPTQIKVRDSIGWPIGVSNWEEMNFSESVSFREEQKEFETLEQVELEGLPNPMELQLDDGSAEINAIPYGPEIMLKLHMAEISAKGKAIENILKDPLL